MLVVAVADWHAFKSNERQEDLNLLDCVNEGVLIIEKDTQQAMYCNKAALKVVDTYLRDSLKEEKLISHESIQTQSWQKAAFFPTKARAHPNHTNSKLIKTFNNTSLRAQWLNLEQVITLQADEPGQLSCIYQLGSRVDTSRSNNRSSRSNRTFYA